MYVVEPYGSPCHNTVISISITWNGNPVSSSSLEAGQVFSMAPRWWVGAIWAEAQVFFSMSVTVSDTNQNICDESTYNIGRYKWNPISGLGYEGLVGTTKARIGCLWTVSKCECIHCPYWPFPIIPVHRGGRTIGSWKGVTIVYLWTWWIQGVRNVALFC